MSPIDADTRRRRAARCREWAAILREDAAAARMGTLALEIEQQLLRLDEQRRVNIQMLSEIDTVVSRAKEALLTSHGLLDLPPYTADDLREGSRLCRAEAEAATETAVRHAFALRALLLAQLAEVTAARLKDGPGQ